MFVRERLCVCVCKRESLLMRERKGVETEKENRRMEMKKRNRRMEMKKRTDEWR